MGVRFLAATDAIYRVAQSQGFRVSHFLVLSHKSLVNKFGSTSILTVKSPIFGVWPNTE